MKRHLFIWIWLVLVFPQIIWGATATIMHVDKKKIEIDIGASRGIVVGMKADVLTNAGQIVHPVTGEEYGNRRVKVGEIEITSVDIESSVGMLTVSYAPISVGDMVDGLVAIPSEQERMQMDIDEARAEIKALARSLADEIKNNQKSIEDLRRTLQRVGSSERRLQSVMNAVQNMRERMVVFENRLTNIEQQQQEMIAQDTAEVDVLGQLNINDMGVLQRGSGDEVFLRIGDRTYRFNFEMNRMEEVAPTEMASAVPAQEKPVKLDEPIADLFAEEETEPASPWYLSWWFLGGVFLVIGLLAGFAILMLKKKQDQSASAAGGDDMSGAGFEEVETDDMLDDLPDDLPELEPAEEEN